MTPSGTRVLRLALLGLGLSVASAVVWSVRRPDSAPGPKESGIDPKAAQTTRMGEFRYTQTKDGQDSIVIEAKDSIGQAEDQVQLQGVTVHFKYKSRQDLNAQQQGPGNGTITSDTGSIESAKQRAKFDGHVHIVTDDGFELTTDSLLYRGDRGLAQTEAPAQFQRQGLTGSCTGLLYDSEEGRVVMKADAFVHVEQKDKPAMEVHSVRAVLLREEGTLEFLENVVVTQGTDTLKSDRFVLFFDEVDHYVSRARALENVELDSSGASGLPGAAPVANAGNGGKRHLKAGSFDMVFRPDHTLEEAVAGWDAELTVEPSATGTQQRKIVKGKTLTFRFDEQGRARQVQGQKDSSLGEVDLGPQPGPARTLSAEGFVADVDPETGEAKSADFTDDVSLVQGTQRATSETASYSAKGSRLTFEKNPRLVDEADHSELVAKVIGIKTNGDVTARQNVRHTLGDKVKSGVGFMGSKEEGPTVATCDLFQYDSDTHTTRYKDGALLRSGRDEVRAQEIRIEQTADDKRRLTATGQVVSVMLPQPQDPAKKPVQKGARPAAPVVTRAQQMVYDQALGQVHYTGDVHITQGDIESTSPEATVYLTPDGQAVQTIVVGEPVQVKQLERIASGRRGTYTPAEQLMELVGDDVALKDPSQEVHGRSVVFHSGDESIVVDGREEVRTQTRILRQGAPRPPTP